MMSRSQTFFAGLAVLAWLPSVTLSQNPKPVCPSEVGAVGSDTKKIPPEVAAFLNDKKIEVIKNVEPGRHVAGGSRLVLDVSETDVFRKFFNAQGQFLLKGSKTDESAERQVRGLAREHRQYTRQAQLASGAPAYFGVAQSRDGKLFSVIQRIPISADLHYLFMTGRLKSEQVAAAVDRVAEKAWREHRWVLVDARARNFAKLSNGEIVPFDVHPSAIDELDLWSNPAYDALYDRLSLQDKNKLPSFYKEIFDSSKHSMASYEIESLKKAGLPESW